MVWIVVALLAAGLFPVGSVDEWAPAKQGATTRDGTDWQSPEGVET